MIVAFQPSHGFRVGQAVRQATATTYALAQADTVAHATAIGVVSRVIDANRFAIATIAEFVSGLPNLMEGKTYWLSGSVAGGLTPVAPTIAMAVLVATSATGGVVLASGLPLSVAATAGAQVLRDANGRAQVADPASGQDIQNYQAVASYVAATALLKSLITAKGDIVVGTGAGTVTVLNAGSDGDVLTADSTQSAGLKYAAGGGGGGGGTASDLLSTLVNAETAITGATTLTGTAFDHMHLCSGTSANYAVTLPAVSGNGGKFIGLRGDTATGLTKVVAVTPATGEAINGRAANATLALLWDEQLILYCDGSTWHVISHTHATWQSMANTITATTTNPTKGTIVADKLWWRRDGSLLRCLLDYEQSAAGAAGSGTYLFGLPSSFAMDTAICRAPSGNLPNASLGLVTVTDMATFSAPASVLYHDSTHFHLADYAVGLIGSGRAPLSATKIAYAGQFALPISGW